LDPVLPSLSTAAAATLSSTSAAQQRGERGSPAADWEEGAVGGIKGDMSMASAAWEDVDGKGPFHCPSPQPFSTVSRFFGFFIP
jgi:hypothetical protein